MAEKLMSALKKPVLLASIVLMAAVGLGAQNRETRIAISYSAPHPLVGQVVDAFKAEVTKSYPQATFVEKHANGNPAEYGSTVLAAIAERPTLLAPLSTPLAKLSVEQSRGLIPVVFMAVTDPVGAGIAKTLEAPGLSTGSSDLCPYDAVLRLARDFMPTSKRLAVPYNPADQPAVFGVEQFKKRAAAHGFDIVERQVPSRDELATEVRAAAGLADAVLLGSDNLLMENPELVAGAAGAVGRPVFSCDSTSVEKGAVAGISIRYADIGTAAGKLAVRVLAGEEAGTIPVAVLTEGSITVNSRAACSARIAIPADVRQVATLVEPDFVCSELAQGSTPPVPLWLLIVVAITAAIGIGAYLRTR